MAGRFADPELFRGYAANLPWFVIARLRGRHDQVDDDLLKRLEGRSHVRLAWSCAPTLGVPKSAFVVWRRKGSGGTQQVSVEQRDVGMDVPVYTWPSPLAGSLASRIDVVATPQDPTRPVHLYALRPRRVNGLYEQYSAAAIIASASAGPSPGQVGLGLTCGGAMGYALVNGTPVTTRTRWLLDDVNSPDWEELEVVGLPVRGEIPDYPPDKQGLVDDLTDPLGAAQRRLKRGLPLVGWPGMTETFHVAPPWQPRDPDEILAVLGSELLPRLTGLYAVSEDAQGALQETHSAPPPSGGDGTATLSPFAALTIPALTDPEFNLGTGFGTAYAFGPGEHMSPLFDGLQSAEFMVTASYGVRPHALGQGDLATIIGRAVTHTSVPSPVGLLAGQAALLPPSTRDAEFHESVRVSWLPTPATAAVVAPGQAAFCTFPPGPGDAEPLMPKTRSGGFEPLTLARRPIDPSVSDSARLNVIHADAPLPFEGGTARGYAVSVGDVFGLWSRWQDVGYAATAPLLEPPRIVNLALTSTFLGSTQCPAELSVEVSLGWTERTPRRIEIVAQFWPMATAKTDPPVPLDPSVAPPAPMFTRTLLVDFAGDTPSAASPSTTVTPLDEDGAPTATPGSASQGDEGRRYLVVYSGDTLDFAAVGRWGVRVWAQVRAAAPPLPTPSLYSPHPDQPATTVAASPVPVVLPPPPPLPGVPMGSSPDAQGLSHVRLVWPPQATPPVHRVVVWETSESVVLSRISPPANPDHAAIPGARLVTLRAAYDGLSATKQQELFRRVGEFDPAPGALDLTLPKGSRDIHFFVVTAVTTTGVESPWPVATGGGQAHEHVQAFMGPRVVQPAPPIARASVDPVSGALSFTMESASRIDVEGFEVFATRSELAALDVMTMGPPVDRVLVPVMPPGARPTDPISADPVYAATWTGALALAWEPWWVRVMAVPRPVIEQAGTRGAFSLPSDLVRVATPPPGPPVLDPLVVTSLGDGLRFRIDTATSALERAVPAGEFVVQVAVSAEAGGAAVAGEGSFGPVPLRSVVAAADVLDPLSLDPEVRRQPRVTGMTPMRIWIERADIDQPVTVVVTVTDPLGRAVSQTTALAPGAGVAPPTLQWGDVFAIVGRGLVARLTSDVPLTTDWTLSVMATKPGLGPLWPVVGPVRPPVVPPLAPPVIQPVVPPVMAPVGRRRLDDLIHLGPGRTLSGSWLVAEIPLADPGLPPVAGEITVRRARDNSRAPTHTFELLVPLAGTTSMVAELSGPRGATVSARWRA